VRIGGVAAFFSLQELTMAGRGPQTFKKRQKEQQRKEKQQEKLAKRIQRKQDKASGVGGEEEESDSHLVEIERLAGI
jgi:hypothetical protein